jgi:hypothetical protein
MKNSCPIKLLIAAVLNVCSLMAYTQITTVSLSQKLSEKKYTNEEAITIFYSSLNYQFVWLQPNRSQKINSLLQGKHPTSTILYNK